MFPPRLRGAVAFIRQAHSTPGSFVCLRDWLGNSLRSLFQPIARSLQTTVPVTQRSRGYRPCTPSSLAGAPARCGSSCGTSEVAPHVCCLVGVGVSGPAVRGLPIVHGRSLTQGASRRGLLLAIGPAAVCPQRGPEPATLYFRPHSSMLYQVRFQYGCMIEASSRDEAYSKAIRLLRDSPASCISDVRQPGEPKKPTSLMRRLITGR